MKVPITLQIKVAIKGIAGVIKTPSYAFGLIILSMLTLGIILWSLNIELFWYIIAQSPLSFVQKLDFVIEIYQGLFTNYEHLQVFVMLVFSILFGINAALLVFVIRHGEARAAKSKSSLLGLIAAIIGGGCIACGTSILTPLIASFGATATIGLNNTIGLTVNLIGIAFVCYSLLGLGQRAATIIAKS